MQNITPSMKFITITGGIISGVGKGVVASSLGAILQARGYTVTFIKIDPYINVDAGTLTPFDHGEVFVLSDGAEVDLDFGNYERFLNISLKRCNSITGGQIYQEVISRERCGLYCGKTVQVVPHVRDVIKERIQTASHTPVLHGTAGGGEYRAPDVCVIELGGTVGDIESCIFVEALRHIKNISEKGDFIVIGLEYIPILNKEEHKTKPIQNSVRQAIQNGLQPDLIVGRCDVPFSEAIIEKMSLFCEVKKDNIFFLPNVESIFMVPQVLERQNISTSVLKMLCMEERGYQCSLNKFSYIYSRKEREVKIALVGKYAQNKDCYLSVENALLCSAGILGYRLVINWIEASDLEKGSPDALYKLNSSNGVLVPGGFGTRGIEGKIRAIKHARENNIPFLGICLGFQMGVIEFARNVAGIIDATSEEFDRKARNKLIVQIDNLDRQIIGASMNLGEKSVCIEKESRAGEIYAGTGAVVERHRHRFEVNSSYLQILEDNGLVFTGKDAEGKRMELFELENHCFFVGVQYHPEFTARLDIPHCLFTEFVKCSSGEL